MTAVLVDTYARDLNLSHVYVDDVREVTVTDEEGTYVEDVFALRILDVTFFDTPDRLRSILRQALESIDGNEA